MLSATYDLSISAVRADALFASALQRSDEPSAGQVRQAIAAAIRVFGDLGCAARVAQAYGEHPETAVTRMCWARMSVADAFGGPEPGPGTCPQAQPVCSFPRRAGHHEEGAHESWRPLDGRERSCIEFRPPDDHLT